MLFFLRGSAGDLSHACIGQRHHVGVWKLVALVCGMCPSARAQSSETFRTVYAKAQQECIALWSDHVFDPLRKKLPLGEDKPTFSMLTNNEKLQAKDRPLADLAIKTLEKCWSLYAPAYSMLPPQLKFYFKEFNENRMP